MIQHQLLFLFHQSPIHDVIWLLIIWQRQTLEWYQDGHQIQVIGPIKKEKLSVRVSETFIPTFLPVHHQCLVEYVQD